MNNPKNLSDIFGRFFLIAGYLPALAFLTLIRWLLLPGLPVEIQKEVSLINDSSYVQEFTVLLLIPAFLAAILVSLTDITIQLYTGKPLLQPGNPLPQKYGAILDKIKAHVSLRKMTGSDVDEATKKQISEAGSELPLEIEDLRRLTGAVLFEKKSFHTTRLGNVLTSLNEYTSRHYGIDAGIVWPRLRSVLPKEFDERLKSQNTSFMFALNLSACSVLFALLWILFGIAGLVGWSHSNLPAWIIVFVGACAGAYIFYRVAVLEAAILIETMTTAFDLFRGALREKLGPPLPATLEAEKRMWSSTALFLFVGDEKFYPSQETASPAKSPSEAASEQR